jgi:predicted aspartyl protease
MRRLVLAAAPMLAVVGCGGGGGGATGASVRTVTAATKPEKRVAVEVIKGKGNDTAVVIPVSIHGHGPYPFIVDTGASQSLVAPALVERLGLPRSPQGATVQGVGGAVNVDRIVIDRWRAAGLRLPAQRIVTIDGPAGPTKGGVAGLLGSDVLSTFGRVTIDYRRGVLEVGARR